MIGGFNHFLEFFTPKLGEDFLFDDHMFQIGWFNHQLVKIREDVKGIGGTKTLLRCSMIYRVYSAHIFIYTYIHSIFSRLFELFRVAAERIMTSGFKQIYLRGLFPPVVKGLKVRKLLSRSLTAKRAVTNNGHVLLLNWSGANGRNWLEVEPENR